MAPDDYYDEMPVNGDEALRAIAAALSQQQAVPEGFVLVPVQPTEEMIAASMIRIPFVKTVQAGSSFNVLGVRAWDAMLAARPEVP